jgi:hypothetical protein
MRPILSAAQSPLLACAQSHAHPCTTHVPPFADRYTVPSTRMHAAPPRTMPPLRQQNLKKLVRKLRANAQPDEQAQALAVIKEGCWHEGVRDFHFQAAVVAVGAIPLLVPLLGPGSPADVQELAAGILGMLSETADDNRVAVAAAGAVPLLVQLMGPGSPVMVQVCAVQLTAFLADNTEIAARIAAAGAIPLLVQFLDPGDGPPAIMQEISAQTLGFLAENDKDAVTVASAGAIPLLVQLLKPGSLSANVQHDASRTLTVLAANSDNAVTIATAGAIPPLAQLLRSDADDVTKALAADALEAIRKGVAANRAAAANASAAVVQDMDRLGVDGPSDVQTEA